MRTTHSAGGVVVNQNGQVLVVNQDGRSWSLPKGHVDAGETTLAAAAREIMEESGVTELEFVKELGSYQRHRIGLDGDDTSELKTIMLFLYRTKQTDLKPLDERHPEARWVSPNSVEELLTHPKDKEFFADILPEVLKCNERSKT